MLETNVQHSVRAAPDQTLSSRRSVAVFAALLLGFLVCVSFGLHRSSLGQWGPYLGEPIDSNVFLGKTRSIRSDEWLVALAWNLSQTRSYPPLQTENISIGNGSAALFAGVPTYHWSTLFRPGLWGFLCFSEESGLSWQSSFATWGTLCSLFALFLVLTNGEVLLSLSGVSWLFFSPFTQWWFSTFYPTILFGASLSVTATIVCFHGSSSLRRWIASAVLAWSASVFALSLYPPFIIPVCLVSVAAFISGFLLWDIPRSPREFFLRLGPVVLGSGISLLIVFIFFGEISDSVISLQNTSYPGSRITNGGAFSALRLWSGFFGPWFSEERLPLGVGNVCEGSSFIFLWPLVVSGFFDSRLRRDLLRYTPLLIACVLLTFWINFGLPFGVARVLGLTMVPEVRAQSGLGLASILLSTLVIARTTAVRQLSGRPFGRLTLISMLITPSLVGGFTAWLGYRLGQGGVTSHLQSWVIAVQAVALTLFSSTIVWGLRKLFSIGVILLVVVPGFLINPISKGLGPIVSSDLLREAARIGQAEPSARWIAFSDNLAPNLLMMAGVKILNSMKITPLTSELRLLDPEGEAESIYNRLAQGVFEPIHDETKALFKLVQSDMWSLQVSPCHPAFEKLGVEYFLFLRRSDTDNQPCLILTNETPLDGRFWLAKRRGSSVR